MLGRYWVCETLNKLFKKVYQVENDKLFLESYVELDKL